MSTKISLSLNWNEIASCYVLGILKVFDKSLVTDRLIVEAASQALSQCHHSTAQRWSSSSFFTKLLREKLITNNFFSRWASSRLGPLKRRNKLTKVQLFLIYHQINLASVVAFFNFIFLTVRRWKVKINNARLMSFVRESLWLKRLNCGFTAIVKPRKLRP